MINAEKNAGKTIHEISLEAGGTIENVGLPLSPSAGAPDPNFDALEVGE